VTYGSFADTYGSFADTYGSFADTYGSFADTYGSFADTCGVALVSRIDKIIGFFCERALQKRRYSAKETII